MPQLDFNNLNELLSFLNNSELEAESASMEKMDAPFSILPGDFVKFAEADIKSSLAHRNINALSNTKRALDCQIECILTTFGLTQIAKDQRWGIPQKLRTIQTLGIITPQIIGKINRMRNLLEHEFENPDLETVTDALDTINIFIAYTNNVFSYFQSALDIYFVDDRYDLNSQRLSLEFDIVNKALTLKKFKIPLSDIMKQSQDYDSWLDSIALAPKDEHFLMLLERLLNIKL